MADDFVANDFDGEFYVAGNQGEVEEEKDHRVVIIRQADSDIFRLNTITSTAIAGNGVKISNTLRMNYWRLINLGVDASLARKIAYLRVLGLTKGFGDVVGRPNAHNCQYSDILIVADNTTYGVTETTDAGDAVVQRGIAHAIPNYADDEDWRKDVKKKVLNIVCIIAFFFRTRGHHYVADMNERYISVWRKCLYEHDTPGLPWEYLAHHTFHYIYPDDLDRIWITAVNESKCAGALQKRITAFACGTAAVGAVQAGVDDISIVFPSVIDLVPDAISELKRCVSIVRGNRWAGAVTRRFYNAPALVINESKLGSLAAVIIGALEATATNNSLSDSPALKRVAANAPITGNLIANMITKAAQDPRMINSLFLEEEEE